MTNIWLSEGPAYHHTSVFCHLSSAAQPASNNDILCRTIVLHCYLYTPPSTLHPKRLLDFSLSQIAFDSTASTNCSHWKPWDVRIGCTSGRCLWMFFYFGYLSTDKAVASTGYTVFRAQSCALEALLHMAGYNLSGDTCFCKVFRAVQCGWHSLDEWSEDTLLHS